MDAAEMEREFLDLYNKVTSSGAPGYDHEEISRFLSKAQERIVLEEYNPLINRTREGFEQTESRRKDLQELVKGDTLTVPSLNQTNVLPNGRFFDLPSDCLYVISEEVTLSSTDSCLNGKRIRIKPITHDYYTINLNNPFKKPNNISAWRLDYQTRRHEIIVKQGTTVAQYHIRYIKKPRPIITSNVIGPTNPNPLVIEGIIGPADCELNPIIHRRITDEAVKIATGITDPQYYQIKTVEQKEAEQ